MIIDEKYVHTKAELENLFSKLSRNGFDWANGESLIFYRPSFSLPVYIHIHKNRQVTYCTHSIPQSSWEYYV